MKIIITFRKVLKYIKEKGYSSFLKSIGEPQYNITETEAKQLLFYINHYEEIHKNYGGFRQWEKTYINSMKEKMKNEK